jgi:hypothetical protein
MRGATVQSAKLRCKACKHEWYENILGSVAISVWTAQIQSLYCSACHVGYKSLSFVVRDPCSDSAEESKSGEPSSQDSRSEFPEARCLSTPWIRRKKHKH